MEIGGLDPLILTLWLKNRCSSPMLIQIHFPLYRPEEPSRQVVVSSPSWIISVTRVTLLLVRLAGGFVFEERDAIAEILQCHGYRAALITNTYHQFKRSMNFHRGFDE